MKREEKKARGSGKFPELRGGRKTRADGLNNIKRASVPQVLSICTSIAFGSAFPTFLFTTKKSFLLYNIADSPRRNHIYGTDQSA